MNLDFEYDLYVVTNPEHPDALIIALVIQAPKGIGCVLLEFKSPKYDYKLLCIAIIQLIVQRRKNIP